MSKMQITGHGEASPFLPYDAHRVRGATVVQYLEVKSVHCGQNTYIRKVPEDQPLQVSLAVVMARPKPVYFK